MTIVNNVERKRPTWELEVGSRDTAPADPQFTNQPINQPRISGLQSPTAKRLLVLFTLLFAVTLLALVPASLYAQEPPPPFDPEQVPAPQSPPIAGVGAPLFQENCAACHGPEGKGDGPSAADLPFPPLAFADPEVMWEKSPALLFHVTKFGRLEKFMPPWQNQLSDEQIWQTLAFVWSLHTDPDEIAQGEALYAASCASCHGPSGAGDGPEAQGSLPDFSDLSYTIKRSQADWLAGWQAAHPDVGGDWSPEQQRSVLEYIRTFSYTPPWESPYRPGPGVIQGVVRQGTPGEALPLDAEVTLQAFIDFQPIATFTTTLDAEGQFVFADLMVDPNVVYMATTPFDGVTYPSQVVSLTPEEPQASVEITVYATTDDPSPVILNRVHWILDIQPGAVVVGQNLVFGNQGDRTYVGQTVEGVDVPVTVAFQVPEGAQQISLQNGSLGGRFQQVGNLIYDTAPVIPGEGTRQIILRYFIPYTGEQLELNQGFLYPIQQINLLAPDLTGLSVEVDSLQFQGVQDIQGQPFRFWQAEDLPPGAVVLRLGGLPQPGEVPQPAQGNPQAAPSSVPQLDPRTPWILGGFVALILVGVLLLAWRQGNGQIADSAEALREEQEKLVAAIARLDDLHALGELDDDRWQEQRSQLKSRLLTVAAQLQENAG